MHANVFKFSKEENEKQGCVRMWQKKVRTEYQ